MSTLKNDVYMTKAIRQAEVAFRKGEVPVGAVVVDQNGTVLGRGHNQTETKKCQTAHAERFAIEAACKKRGDWRLEGCSIYITLEPCLMCFGLIHLSRLSTVYFGARSPLFGFGLVEYAPAREAVSAYKKELSVHAGLKGQKCADMLKSFFRSAREKEGRG